MSLKQIENEVTQLSPAELQEFSSWFDNYVADSWDKQIEKDSTAGKFDHIFADIEKDIANGSLQSL